MFGSEDAVCVVCVIVGGVGGSRAERRGIGVGLNVEVRGGVGEG